MNYKKVLLIILSITMIAITGCKKEKTNMANKEIETFGSSNSEDITGIKDYDYSFIDTSLKLRNNLGAIKWSPDKSIVAFIEEDLDENGEIIFEVGKVYLWKIGESEPINIEGIKHIPWDFLWSPDSKYIVVDAGTSVTRTGYMVNASDKQIIYDFVYLSKVHWSPDSKYLAIALESEVEYLAPGELIGTTDIYLFNVETKEKELIEEGTEESYFYVTEWDNDGIIHYERLDYEDVKIDMEYNYHTGKKAVGN